MYPYTVDELVKRHSFYESWMHKVEAIVFGSSNVGFHAPEVILDEVARLVKDNDDLEEKFRQVTRERDEAIDRRNEATSHRVWELEAEVERLKAELANAKR